MQVAFLILLFVLGACLGSFLCCQARRLHSKATKPRQKLNRRSICLHCRYQLSWYDNLPIISWLFLKGKCRKCHQPIGITELLAECGTGLAFLLFGLGSSFSGVSLTALNVSPISWWLFGLSLLLITILAFLAIYDGLYGELPTLALIIAIFIAILIAILRTCSAPFAWQSLIDLLFSLLILGGTYLTLYLISKGQWVGDGDWLLGIALALALGTPWLAIIVLFLSNFLAFIIMFPFVKKTRHAKIYFGPFMVIAFIIVYSFSTFFCDILNLW